MVSLIFPELELKALEKLRAVQVLGDHVPGHQTLLSIAHRGVNTNNKELATRNGSPPHVHSILRLENSNFLMAHPSTATEGSVRGPPGAKPDTGLLIYL